MINRFRISAAITKFDPETRRIEGTATAEVLDAHGEIVDYETAKSVITATWPGNFREMHKPEAVGNGGVIGFDDATKSIQVGGIVSEGAPNTWAKCKDGTLKFFSIGGRAKERRAEKLGDRMVKRLFMESIDEISLVDNGACPTASFAIAKSVDGALSPLETDTELPVEKGSAGNPRPYQVTQAAALIAALNELLASDIWDINYADSDGSGASPEKLQEVELLRAAINSLMQYLNSKFAGQFPTDAGDAGASAAATVVEVETAEVTNARFATLAKSALALLQDRVTKAGARHSAKDQKMIQGVHDHSVGLGATCDKADEKTDDADAKKIATAIKGAGLTATDIRSIQVLDRAGKPLGEPIVINDADPAKGATPSATHVGELVVKVADLPDVQKLIDDAVQKERDVTKATMTAQAAAIVDLTDRLSTIEKGPAAGGPAVRVAEKHIGPGSDPNAGGASTLTPEALTEVIKFLPEGAAKDQLIAKLHTMNVAAGIGVTVIGAARA